MRERGRDCERAGEEKLARDEGWYCAYWEERASDKKEHASNRVANSIAGPGNTLQHVCATKSDPLANDRDRLGNSAQQQQGWHRQQLRRQSRYLEHTSIILAFLSHTSIVWEAEQTPPMKSEENPSRTDRRDQREGERRSETGTQGGKRQIEREREKDERKRIRGQKERRISRHSYHTRR